MTLFGRSMGIGDHTSKRVHFNQLLPFNSLPTPLDPLEYQRLKFSLEQEDQRRRLRVNEADDLINNRSAAGIKHFYDGLALYAAGALSLSVSFFTAFAAQHGQALRTADILGISNMHLLFFAWIALLIALGCSLGLREIGAYYEMNRGMEILLEARESFNKKLLELTALGFPLVSADDTDTQTETERISKQIKRVRVQRKHFEWLTDSARIVARISFVAGIATIAAVVMSFFGEIASV